MISYELFKLGVPIINPGMDGITRMVADLRTWEIVPHPDSSLPFSSLLPLRQGDERSGLPHKWANALEDGELALGYYPGTPKNVSKWFGIVENFTTTPNNILYRVMGREYPDQTLAEVDFTFTLVGDLLEAEFVYGLLDRSVKSCMITSSAFIYLCEVLPEIISMTNNKLSKLRSLVSDKNTASMRIVEKAGFNKSIANSCDSKPSLLGGVEYLYERIY